MITEGFLCQKKERVRRQTSPPLRGFSPNLGEGDFRERNADNAMDARHTRKAESAVYFGVNEELRLSKYNAADAR